MSSMLNVFSMNPLGNPGYGEALEVLTIVVLLALRIARDVALGSDHPKVRRFAEAADIGAAPLLLAFLGIALSKLTTALGLLG